MAGLEIVHDELAGVRLAGGRVVGCTALVVMPRMVAAADVVAELGLAVVDHPFGEHLPADPSGLTPVPGVWVAGNARNLAANVVVAAAEGVTAAAAVNADLVEEDTRRAVERRRIRLGGRRVGGLHPAARRRRTA